MNKLLLTTFAVALSLTSWADSSTTTTSTASDAGITTTTTTTVPGNTQQSMEEAPAGELSSPSVAPTEDPSLAPADSGLSSEPSFQSAPYEEQRMEDVDVEEEDEYVPGSNINDVDEEEEY